jgi:hypothetical protein
VLSVAPTIDDANAALFFSTTVLLMGVLVTVIGTAFVQILLDIPETSDASLKKRSRQNSVILTLLIICDLWGVGFPFAALYASAVGKVTPSLISHVLVSTIVVILGNLALPVYVASLFRKLYWFDLSNITRPKILLGRAPLPLSSRTCVCFRQV